MQLPVELHNKRLVGKTVEKNFDSAEVMFFPSPRFSLSRSAKEDIERKGGRGKDRKRIVTGGVEGVCVCVCGR